MTSFSRRGGLRRLFGLIFIWVQETRPAAARQKGAAKPLGYSVVLRRPTLPGLLRGGLLALIPFGQFGAIYSTYITTEMGVKYSTWPLLLALNAGIVAALQFPAIALSRGRDPMRLMALASLLIAIGVGGVAFAHRSPRWLSWSSFSASVRSSSRRSPRRSSPRWPRRRFGDATWEPGR